MTVIDTITALSCNLTIAEKIAEELDLLQGCKGTTTEINEAIGQYRQAVKDLHDWVIDAQIETNDQEGGG